MRYVLIILLAGCTATPRKVVYLPPQDTTRTVMVHLVSDPPGARIVIANDYVGDAPCDIPIKVTKKYSRENPGEVLGEFLSDTTIITAVPAHTGETEQIVRLERDFPCPKRVLFNMALRSTPRDWNVRLSDE